jgi:alpha-beta hydrolase superfamily lysophospholipase
MDAVQRKRKNKLMKWIKIIVVLYVLVGAILYFLQDKILLHPVALPADYHFQFNAPFQEIFVPYNGSISFDVIRFESQNGSVKKGAVIYFHGNMENINRYAKFANNFAEFGYDVWMMDYPSFGKSKGKFDEAIVYEEALQVYKMVRAAGYAPDSIIIYGKSLGTGIATQLASVRDCKRLILESPYYSLSNLAAYYCWMYPVDWMLRYKMLTNEYVKNVTAPVTIFHGTEDETIPFSNAEKLQKESFKKEDELIPIKGGHHNDLNDFPLMKEKLDSLLML